MWVLYPSRKSLCTTWYDHLHLHVQSPTIRFFYLFLYARIELLINEILPNRTTTGLRFCNYGWLNEVTRKDHFSLPFIDQIQERIASQGFYCRLDGYFGYNQISIASKDQDQLTFTFPRGTYDYWKISFGMYSDPFRFLLGWWVIHLHYHVGNFSFMDEKFLWKFMCDFTLFHKTFDDCIYHLICCLKDKKLQI